MPSVVLKATDETLGYIASGHESLEDFQDNMEDKLLMLLARVLTTVTGEKVLEEQIEIIWTPVKRARNMPQFPVDVVYSERTEGSEKGFAINVNGRTIVLNSVVAFLEQTKLLPSGMTVSAWVQPHIGGMYSESTVK